MTNQLPRMKLQGAHYATLIQQPNHTRSQLVGDTRRRWRNGKVGVLLSPLGSNSMFGATFRYVVPFDQVFGATYCGWLRTPASPKGWLKP